MERSSEKGVAVASSSSATTAEANHTAGTAAKDAQGSDNVGKKAKDTTTKPSSNSIKEETYHDCRKGVCHLKKPNGHQTSKGSPILLTFFVGSLYGNMLTPINYLVLHSTETGNPSNVSAYFFSFCVGALLMSTIIFMIYSTAKKNRPFINPELTLPSLTSGIIYAIATYGFFLANQHLDQTIAYPIISKSPGIVVSLWAVFLFHEIKGVRDLTTLVVGITTTIVGIVLISISKINFQ